MTVKFMRAPRLRFLTKLLAMFIGIVVLLQAVTYFAARAALLESTVNAARNTLKIGVDVFANSMQAHTDQLKNSVGVLVNDFGFREAVATRDAATIESALQNQASRIQADRAMVIDAGGQWLADTGTGAVSADTFTELMAAADRSGIAAANLVVDGVPYIYVVSTVRAPVRIGWVAMGFKLDNREAEAIKRLTLLDVSFFIGGDNTARYVSGTLTAEQAELLRAAVMRHLPAAPTQLMLGENLAMTSAVKLTEGGEALIAVLQLPMQQALQPYYRLTQQLRWIALAGLLLAAAIAYVMARRLTHSVRQLASATARIATGDYGQTVVADSRDEIGDLADTLNTMQQAIVDREQRIVFQAEHDRLTGLPSRVVATRKLIEAIGHADSYDNHDRHDNADNHNNSAPVVSVVVIDINHFKAINDTFGHGIGDKVLCHVAERTLSSVKHGDTVVRLGNDEFLVVLAGIDKAQAITIAQRLLQNIAAPLQLGELKFNIDAHAGIATCPEDSEAAEVLIRRADIAMTLCKQNSKNPLSLRYASYQQGWEELRLRRLALVHDLLEAINSDGLQLKYQPKLSFKQSNYLGAEALVRWQHPQLGFIGPDEFIPLAESSGHIVALTRWVIDTAVAQIAKWSRENIVVKVSVNISALDLLDDTLPDYLQTTLKLHGVDVSSLCLELTESSVMFEVQRSMESLQRLHDMGLRLSIDDFGTGHSSLAQLKKLPIDELKIDKSFVLKLDESEDDQVIVRSTIELGHNMDLEIVAEGIETEAARELLRTFGCDMMQGYLLAKPISGDEFSQWATARAAKRKLN
ncbi:MAG: EAL domain-containing protein [Spongiibacteraceae bacterium]